MASIKGIICVIVVCVLIYLYVPPILGTIISAMMMAYFSFEYGRIVGAENVIKRIEQDWNKRKV